MADFSKRLGAAARTEQVELDYVFDFDEAETVVYMGGGPVPGRVFVLRFWRHAKDGIMHLLGYHKQGHWRDPTVCLPNSFVRYYRPQHPPAHPPHTPPDDMAGNRPSREQPQDTMQRSLRPHQSIEQLAYRVPLLKLDHGVWELPTLRGQPVHLISHVLKTPRKPPLPRRTIVTPPPVESPIERTLEFVNMSTHFQHPAQADRELGKLLSVLKQFPQLQVTIQGNYQMAPGYLIRGYGPYVRDEQARRFASPYTTKWPDGVESYNSIGQVMDSRARAIQQYLISHGINAKRVHTARGQYTDKKTFTIIFSN